MAECVFRVGELPYTRAYQSGAAAFSRVRMDHQQRLGLYRQYMASKGVDPKISTPVIWEFLWRHGLQVPPPPFINPVLMALAYVPLGLAFPLILGVIFMVLSAGHGFYFPPRKLVEAMMIGSALIIGLGTPLYYRGLARRCGLGSWSTFIGHPQRPLP